MSRAIRNFCGFGWRCARLACDGDWRYHLWIGALFAVCLLGLNAYAKQLVHGLIVTDMTDQVSWGVYIANFTFLVGVAAAAVMLVIPVYIYKNEELHDLVIFGELLAIAAILMCLAFVMVDLGRPDRFWHLIPGIGKFNFPGSLLSWDVIVLNGYLVLNIYVCAYLLYCRYCKQPPVKWLYLPVIFVGILWAISIHTVTAFLYVGLGGRPFWNSAIIGPRFLASAFTAGPALIILALQVVRRVTARAAENGTGTAIGSEEMASRAATLADFEELSRHFPEIAAVPAEIRQICLASAMVLEASPGHVFLHQGTKGSDAFFVLAGRVSVNREDSGRIRTVRTLIAGEQFGEISALASSPRTATATAEEPARVLRVSSEAVRQLMKTPVVGRIIRSRMHDRLMISDRALLTLRSIVQVSMLINVFLLLNEVFKEFYTGNLHVAASQYLYFGLHGHHALVPWIWTAIACNLIALVLLVLPVSRSLKWLDVACVLAIVGIWIEKGMGLVIPGFVPSPLGEIVEYSPTLNETLVCFGIWAFGLLCYTVFLRMAVPVLQGKITQANESACPLNAELPDVAKSNC
ncbi:MAG: polysulfide reductase NrfD [Verrucomicrobia bacterium]|nr:polysulfide reductase NrfD [Verrucomicrobiota bacterium]